MHRSTTARRTARTLAFAAGLAALTAPAAGAYVGGPGNGKPFGSDRPDLRTATVLDPAFGNRVRFCFDQPIDRILATDTEVRQRPNGDGTSTPVSTVVHNFLAQTYDANRFMVAQSVAKDANDPACVVATFREATQLSEGTIASINDNAVIDAANRGALRDSVPLQGASPSNGAGRTTGPDLLGVTPNGSQAVFSFDERVAGAGNGLFRAQTSGGNVIGSTLAEILANGTQVRVTFGADVSTATRFLALEGAVSDRPQDKYVAGRVGGTATGNGSESTEGPVTVPVLQRIDRIDASTLEATFSENIRVENARAGQLQLVFDDGRVDGADAFSAINSEPNRLRATFNGEPWKEPESVVRVTDIGGAAVSLDGSRSSSIGTVRLSTPPVAPGYTNGPDLLGATFDGRTNEVTLRFDETLGSTAGPGTFFALGRTTSDVFTGTGTVPTSGATARVTVSSAAAASTGAGLTGPNQLVDTEPANDELYSVAAASGRDGVGTGSPRGLVSYETEPFPPGPPPPAPPVVGSGTPAPVVVPPRVRFVTQVTFKRTGGSGRRKYSGRIRSQGRGCRSGRRIVLKRVVGGRTRTVTSVFTKGDGTFALRRKRIPGRVYAFVTERGGTQVFCRSAKSRTIRG